MERSCFASWAAAGAFAISATPIIPAAVKRGRCPTLPNLVTPDRDISEPKNLTHKVAGRRDELAGACGQLTGRLGRIPALDDEPDLSDFREIDPDLFEFL